MNILLYTMTMLMVFALLAYSKMESYRTFSHVQIQFQQYMEKIERKHLSDQALALYNKTTVSTRSGKETPKSSASPRITWAPIINKTERDKNMAAYEQAVIWSKRLLDNLYGEQPFFKEGLEKRPSLLDELFSAIVKAADQSEKKLSKASDLANLDLNDPILNDFLYKILKGNQALDRKPFYEYAEAGDDSAVDAELESQESKADEGYVSLLDFITTAKSQKLRLYLASPQVLASVLGSQALVNDICEERQNCYRMACNDNAQAATVQFMEFMKGRLGTLDLNQFDFSVTTSNPRDYER